MHRFLQRTIMMLMLVVGFCSSALAEGTALAEGYYRIMSRKTNLPVHVHNRQLGYVSEQAGAENPNNIDLTRVWKVKLVNDKYWIINVSEGLPVQQHGLTNVTFSVGYSPADYYIKAATGTGSNGYWVISTNPEFKDKTLWHNGGSGLVQNWENPNGENNHWKFEALNQQERKQVESFEQQWPKLEAGFLHLAQLREGGLYRIKNAQGQYWQEDTKNNQLKTTTTASSTDFSTLWIVEANGDGFAFRNAATSRYAASVDGDKPLTTSLDNRKLWLDFKHSSEDYYNISGNNTFADGSCFVFANNTLKGGNARNKTTQKNEKKEDVTVFSPNTAADWQLEKPTDVSEDDIKAEIRKKTNAAFVPVENKHYLIRNVAYPNRVLTVRSTSTNVMGDVRNEREMGQIWTFVKVDGQWAIRSVVNQHFVGNSAGRSANYQMTESQAAFTIQQQDKWFPYLAFVGPNGGSLHCASSADFKVVNWDASATASKWQLEEIKLDEKALQAYNDKINTQNELKNNSQSYSEKLNKFFKDYACTELQDNYKAMTDEQFKAALKAENLPQLLIDMALRVKTNTWNSQNTEANHYEKFFRIQDYQSYSHPQKWARENKLMPITFNQYSQLTNPTGITIPEKEFVLLFVDKDTPNECELNAELVQGKSTTGSLTKLHKGVNVIYSDQTAHLYINYVINNVELKHTDQPKIRIHVEGGKANGFFDINTMTNADWDKLRTLKKYDFFTDDVIRLKSKHTIHSVSLSGVEEQQDKKNWIYNGEDKGIVGVLGKWDWVHTLEQEFFTPKRYEDRFNCLMFSTDASGLYAFPYGTFIGTVSSTFSYHEWAKGSQYDNAGNLWAVVHETGHHYQRLFNLARCLESSNNLWSNIAVWKRGASVSRLQNSQKLFDRFNNKKSWLDMDLNDRTRMYWQLWLYYVELGHKPTFFNELFDKFRENPIDFSNAKTDFLRFARFCSEIAKEDLTEFFTFYGFFNKVGKDIPYKYNDDFYDKSYGAATITIDQADIDACKAVMKQYPKKNTNLIFIDERIRKTPATYEGAKPGEMRWGTIGGMDPGDNRVFGDVGHYEDFGKPGQPGTSAAPQAVLIDGRTVRIQGTGAVGYKVYDETGNLVMVANTNDFLIPNNLTLAKLTVNVVGGNGEEVKIIENGQVVEQYKKRFTFDNPANLTLSEGKNSPLGRYYIRKYEANDGKLYYLTKEGRPTDQLDNAGQFLVMASRFSGEYYLYSVGMDKWISYDPNKNYWGHLGFYGEPNLLRWSGEMTKAQTWKITRENNYYKIALQKDSRVLWNWHGGINPNNSVGFYNTQNDAGSRWVFVPADFTTKYLALVKHADSIMVRDAAKAVNTAPYHQEFRKHLAKELERLTATEDDITALKSKLAAWETWRTADSTLTADASRVVNTQKLLNEFKAKLAATTLATSTDATALTTLKAQTTAWKTWLTADSTLAADASRSVNTQKFLGELKTQLADVSLVASTSEADLNKVKKQLPAWKEWLKADELLQKDANKAKHSLTFYNSFKTNVTNAAASTAATEPALKTLSEQMTAWPVWRDADSLVQIPPYGNPLNTKFRQPFTVLVEKDYTEVAQVQELKDFSRYFRLLVTADSLLSQTNPGYPLAKFKEMSGVEAWPLQDAAAEPKPDFDWASWLESIPEMWVVPANRPQIKTDKEAYFMPEDGKIYRLRSYYDDRYITSEPANSSNDGIMTPLSLSKQVNNSTLWILQQDQAGKQYLAAASGKGYLSRMANKNHGSLSNEPAEISFGTARFIQDKGMHQQKVGTLYIRNAGMSLVGWKNDDAIGGHPGTDANPVWHGDNGVAGTSFYFDTVADATFTVTTYAGSNGNYATTQLPFAAKIPEGLIVYRVKQVAAEKNLELELFEGNVLPANTPVILSSETAGSFELHPTTWAAPLETKLRGTNLPLKASEKSSGMKYYALTIDDDTQELLFRLVENDVEIPGNRAYFTLPLGTPAASTLSFVLPPVVTKVKATATKNSASQKFFNLAGQRVNASSATGVVISQGQKMIIR